MSVTEYTKQLLSVEEYSFSLDEVLRHSTKDIVAVKRELSRLSGKKEILNLRKGFYLIIPPRYSNAQKLPIQLYSEKLFDYLQRKYYVALFSAAKIHGAGHQQSQRDYLITETPKLNTIRKWNFDIGFYTTQHWPKTNILTKRSDAGAYRVSSPALTFIDLIHHHTKIGGLNRALATLEELAEEIQADDLATLVDWYDNKSSLQRAGFLLDELMGSNALTDILIDKLKNEPYYPTLLSPSADHRLKSANNRWKIDVNIKLENDL